MKKDAMINKFQEKVSSKRFEDKIKSSYRYTLKKGEEGSPENMVKIMNTYFLEIHNETREWIVDYIKNEIEEIKKRKKPKTLEEQIDFMLDVMLFLKNIEKFEL